MKDPENKNPGSSLARSASALAAINKMHSSGGGNAMTDKDRVADFARVQLVRYYEYHAHKENMAYVGFALFAGVVGTILVSVDWPPVAWGVHKMILALIGLSVAWLALLFYLHFQLRRRRWAALRIAACERVLARWVTNDLAADDVKVADRNSSSRVGWACWFVDFFLPLRGSVKAIEKLENTKNPKLCYPQVFVSALEEAESNGTAAIYHEWLMYGTGWLLYFAAMIRTCPAILNIPTSLLRLARRLV